MTSKKSIRFFNDREVRAVWDDENSKWWFSATDIVRAINDEDDYVKAGNYWRWLKKKLVSDGIQLVSITHDFKFQAPDGKQRYADALDLGLIDEVSMMYGYGIDGRGGMAAAFDGRPMGRKPVRLTFKSVEEQDGIVWIRYQVNNK